MEFKSYEEIMEYLSECVVEQRDILRKLSEKGVSFFDYDKREARKRLKVLKERLKYYNNFIESATTFDSDLLVSFLVGYLSKHTDSRYLVCRAEKDESAGRTYYRINYKCICSATDVMKMQINGYDVDSRLDFNTINSHLADRAIMINEEHSYSLMGIDGLHRTFESFPELMEVGKKLVNLKIAFPMMNDEERLANVLGNTMSNCRLNWKVKSFNRKIPNGKRIGDMSFSEIFSSKR